MVRRGAKGYASGCRCAPPPLPTRRERERVPSLRLWRPGPWLTPSIPSPGRIPSLSCSPATPPSGACCGASRGPPIKRSGFDHPTEKRSWPCWRRAGLPASGAVPGSRRRDPDAAIELEQADRASESQAAQPEAAGRWPGGPCSRTISVGQAGGRLAQACHAAVAVAVFGSKWPRRPKRISQWVSRQVFRLWSAARRAKRKRLRRPCPRRSCHRRSCARIPPMATTTRPRSKAKKFEAIPKERAHRASIVLPHGGKGGRTLAAALG